MTRSLAGVRSAASHATRGRRTTSTSFYFPPRRPVRMLRRGSGGGRMRMLSTLGALAAVACLGAPSRAEGPAEAGARVPLELYFKGHATGDGEYFRKAFHADAKIQGIREGKLLSR